MTSTHKEIQQKLQSEKQVLSSHLQNVNDQDTNELAGSIEAQLHDKMQVRLVSIERALIRLDKGTFGMCQSCGEQIDEERLRVLPYAEQCIHCQRKLERKTVRQYAYA